MKINNVNTMHGFKWIKEAYYLFKLKPVSWICISILYVIVTTLLMIIPYVGSIFMLAVKPLLIAGICLGCLSLENGESISEKCLLLGFKKNFLDLLLVGLFFIFGILILSILLFGLFFVFNKYNFPLFIYLLSMMIVIPMAMSTWFAPPLVLIHGIKPFEAMVLSAKASVINLNAFILFGLLVLVIIALSIITCGLGLLIAVPVIIISGYTSYKDIFVNIEQNFRAFPFLSAS